jgi:hypothetical protein
VAGANNVPSAEAGPDKTNEKDNHIMQQYSTSPITGDNKSATVVSPPMMLKLDAA